MLQAAWCGKENTGEVDTSLGCQNSHHQKGSHELKQGQGGCVHGNVQKDMCVLVGGYGPCWAGVGESKGLPVEPICQSLLQMSALGDSAFRMGKLTVFTSLSKDKWEVDSSCSLKAF